MGPLEDLRRYRSDRVGLSFDALRGQIRADTYWGPKLNSCKAPEKSFEFSFGV